MHYAYESPHKGRSARVGVYVCVIVVADKRGQLNKVCVPLHVDLGVNTHELWCECCRAVTWRNEEITGSFDR